MNKPNSERAEQAVTKTQLDGKNFWRVSVRIILLISGLLYWWHYNPLLSDEGMIAHFHEHRTEIEELVKRYRACVTTVGTSCEGLPENQALMEKALVKRVVDEGPAWPPNPYSQEAIKQFDDSIRAGKIPSLNPYSSIFVELLDEDDPERHFARVLTSSGSRWIFKGLMFMPGIVRIENGDLWYPAHPFLVLKKRREFFQHLMPIHQTGLKANAYTDNLKRTGLYACVQPQFNLKTENNNEFNLLSIIGFKRVLWDRCLYIYKQLYSKDSDKRYCD